MAKTDTETLELPKRLIAVYGSKSKKSVHVGKPGGCTLLVVRGGTYGDNFDVLQAMVDAYNREQSFPAIDDPKF